MKFLLYTVLLSGLLTAKNYSNSINLSENQQSNYTVNSIIYATIGLISGAGATDFFREYNTFLGGKESKFVISPSLGAGTKFDLFRGYRIGINAFYYQAVMLDSYISNDTSIQVSRSISQNIKIEQIPVFVTFEIIPYTTQFRTYAGVGVGAVFNQIYWREDISTPVINDKRKGGLHFDESIIAPAFKFYTGVDLGFDKNYYESILGSFILEVNYIYNFTRVEIFRSIGRQFYETPESWKAKFDLLNGYLSLNIAISFNFNFKTGKK